jgi:hypothetical protein
VAGAHKRRRRATAGPGGGGTRGLGPVLGTSRAARSPWWGPSVLCSKTSPSASALCCIYNGSQWVAAAAGRESVASGQWRCDLVTNGYQTNARALRTPLACSLVCRVYRPPLPPRLLLLPYHCPSASSYPHFSCASRWQMAIAPVCLASPCHLMTSS